MKTVAVIGLGKFGFYIAKSLSRQEGYRVIAVDTSEQRIQEMSEHIEDAYILNSTNKTALKDAGIVGLDMVIVSIGENIEASILTVMALKDLDNHNIVAKAITTTHGEILAKIGAFKVIHPEKVAGKILIESLVENINVEKIDLSNSMRILKMRLPEHFYDKTIEHLIEVSPTVKLISYKTDGHWFIDINLSHEITKNDVFAFLGDSKSIERFYENLHE